jgi:Fibronectin type III domain
MRGMARRYRVRRTPAYARHSTPNSCRRGFEPGTPGLFVACLLLALLVAAWANPALLTAPHTGIGNEDSRDSAAGAAPAGSPYAAATLANPSSCRQGSATIALPPGGTGVDMHSRFLEDYAALGAEGGGTLLLEAGVYQLNETTVFDGYSNVSIQGAGIGSTVLSLPPDPIGEFYNTGGHPVSLFNLSLEANGPNTGNFIQTGPSPIDNFEVCDLTINNEVNNASEDWAGSTIYDESGGLHHVYSDIALTDYAGDAGTPNGLHVLAPSVLQPAVGYIIDDLYADNDSWSGDPSHTFAAGGPDFLDTGGISNSTEANITAIGDLEYETRVDYGLLAENINVTGHVTIDPDYESAITGFSVPAGSWGNSLFQNVTIDDNGTGGPNAMRLDVANGTSHGTSDFSGLRWNDDHFFQGVDSGSNLVDATNCTFYGGLDAMPATFEDNTVTWVPSDFGRESMSLPIVASGLPAGGPVAGTTSTVIGNTFNFLYATNSPVLFALAVPHAIWLDDVYNMNGTVTFYLTATADVPIALGSEFEDLMYEPINATAPAELYLVDIHDSPGYIDDGAVAIALTLILNNMAAVIPAAPTALSGSPASYTQVALSWVNPTGNGSLVGSIIYVYQSNCTTLLATYVEGDVFSSVVIGGLNQGDEYCFSVSAVNATAQGFLSEAALVYTYGVPSVAPSRPALGDRTNTSALLTWTQGYFGDNSTPTNDTVLLGAMCGDWTSRTNTTGPATEFSIGSLSRGSGYCAAIEMWNESGGHITGDAVTFVSEASGAAGSGGGLFGGSSGTIGGTSLNTLEVLAIGGVTIEAAVAFVYVLVRRSGSRRSPPGDGL